MDKVSQCPITMLRCDNDPADRLLNKYFTDVWMSCWNRKCTIASIFNVDSAQRCILGIWILCYMNIFICIWTPGTFPLCFTVICDTYRYNDHFHHPSIHPSLSTIQDTILSLDNLICSFFPIFILLQLGCKIIQCVN